MKNKILIGLLLTSMTLFAGVSTSKDKKINFGEKDMIDFGIRGQMYDIKEKNILEEMHENIKKMDIKKQLGTALRKAIKKQTFARPNLPYIKKNHIYETENYVILPRDVKKLNGDVIYKKGDKYFIDQKEPLNICFVDGSNQIMLANQIKYFDSLVKKTGSQRDCFYFLANASVLKANQDFPPKTFYPLEKHYADKFMVKSIPTYIHIKNKKREVKEFSINMFKHEVK